MESSGKGELKKMLILTKQKLKRYKKYNKHHLTSKQKYEDLQKLYIILSNALMDQNSNIRD